MVLSHRLNPQSGAFWGSYPRDTTVSMAQTCFKQNLLLISLSRTRTKSSPRLFTIMTSPLFCTSIASPCWIGQVTKNPTEVRMSDKITEQNAAESNEIQRWTAKRKAVACSSQSSLPTSFPLRKGSPALVFCRDFFTIREKVYKIRACHCLDFGFFTEHVSILAAINRHIPNCLWSRFML